MKINSPLMLKFDFPSHSLFNSMFHLNDNVTKEVTNNGIERELYQVACCDHIKSFMLYM